MKQQAEQTGTGRRLISVVTPVHDEEANITPFHTELTAVLDGLEYDFELVFVDDGSADGSAARIAELPAHNRLVVRLIELSRNFGKEVALTAGIEAARGAAVLLIDSDLQHPVGKIPDFLAAWEAGNEVVVGVRTVHKGDTLLKRHGSKAFYSIMNKIGETESIPHATDYRLLDRMVVDSFLRFTERQRITRGLVDWLGFRRAVVYFEAEDRRFGTPSYSTLKLFELAINSFISHSLLPLKIAGYLGTIITSVSGLLGIFIIIERYFMHDPLGLNPSNVILLALLLVFLVGIILASLGLIALYIANIHGEVINRPLYVTRPERALGAGR